jgi:hypothetical protein
MKMSTRTVVILKDETSKVIFYRHSDGYPACTGEDLKKFVEGYRTGMMRDNVGQSAGWIIVRGHAEYLEKNAFTGEPTSEGFSGWKVGAYEPAGNLGMGEEYIYIIDLEKMTLTCRVPGKGYDENPTLKNTRVCKEFPAVSFAKTEEVAS